jgi:heme/copper-type cytochrome/quinol oxidase subunit 4
VRILVVSKGLRRSVSVVGPNKLYIFLGLRETRKRNSNINALLFASLIDAYLAVLTKTWLLEFDRN